MKLPQLSLRDLFWLVLVCALALAWWIERRAHVRDVEMLRLIETLVRDLHERNEQLEQAALQEPASELEYSGIIVEVVDDPPKEDKP